MRTALALVAGLVVSAVVAPLVQGCKECTHTVHEVTPGTYRMDFPAGSTDDTNYRLVYTATAEPPTVVETYNRTGTEVRIEYTASPPSP